MQVHFEDRESWRAWLQEHHRDESVVWLVFDKKHTGKPCISYDAAVEEALCFGWIDSIIKRIDGDRYVRKFTPRTNAGNWSAANLERVRKLVRAGRMTDAGLAKLAPGVAPPPPASSRGAELPAYFADALAGNGPARRFFERLAPSHRRRIIGWVESAKRQETRARRVEEALTLLAQGKMLGMK